MDDYDYEYEMILIAVHNYLKISYCLNFLRISYVTIYRWSGIFFFLESDTFPYHKTLM